jgi:selenium metabolism protein YedF
MAEMVDARGLTCPEPVIRTKKALDVHDEVTVLVDNTTALENVKRLGTATGCVVNATEETGGIFRIEIKRGQGGSTVPEELLRCEVPTSSTASGPTVFVIASTAMGEGSDELGTLLMRAFVHTTVELEHKPDIMILYNTGVKVAVTDSPVIDDLRALEEKGVNILVCGTCANYFELTDKIGVGTISNMYDIASTLSTAGRIVKP